MCQDAAADIKVDLDQAAMGVTDTTDDVLVAEYLSDDEKARESDSDSEELVEENHVTKVCVPLITSRRVKLREQNQKVIGNSR